MKIVILICLIVSISSQTPHPSFDLNKTATSDEDSDKKGEEEVQSKLADQSKDTPFLKDWVNKRPRAARQARISPIEPIIIQRPQTPSRQKKRPIKTISLNEGESKKQRINQAQNPRSVLSGQKTCKDGHSVSCPHWIHLPLDERRRQSAKAYKRRYRQTPEGKAKVQEEYARRYKNLTREEKNKYQKHLYQQRLLRTQKLPRKEQLAKKAKHAGYMRAFRERRRQKEEESD